jgi:hypothetical protein
MDAVQFGQLADVGRLDALQRVDQLERTLDRLHRADSA